MSADKITDDQPGAEQEPGEPRAVRGRTGLARVRRRPSIPAFLATGVILGALAGVLYAQTTGDGNYSSTTATAYVVVIFALLGLLVGAIAVIVLDKIADR